MTTEHENTRPLKTEDIAKGSSFEFALEGNVPLTGDISQHHAMGGTRFDVHNITGDGNIAEVHFQSAEFGGKSAIQNVPVDNLVGIQIVG